eukprot:SAG22_NODE_2919_length_2103_cov_2.492016_2_plen_155_part_01
MLSLSSFFFQLLLCFLSRVPTHLLLEPLLRGSCAGGASCCSFPRFTPLLLLLCLLGGSDGGGFLCWASLLRSNSLFLSGDLALLLTLAGRGMLLAACNLLHLLHILLPFLFVINHFLPNPQSSVVKKKTEPFLLTLRHVLSDDFFRFVNQLSVCC